jgi:hypothetical protein
LRAGPLQASKNLVLLREAADGLLREDELVVDDDVELTLAARNRVGGVSVQSVDLGGETRGPCVVAASGGAVEDADGSHAVTYTDVRARGVEPPRSLRSTGT